MREVYRLSFFFPPEYRVIPSTAILSSTTPLRGAVIVTESGTFFVFSISVIVSDGTSRFSRRCWLPAASPLRS
jgi:hypothetical protein